MKLLIENTAILLLLAFFVAAFATGCAHQQRSVELQCVGATGLREDIEGPVVLKDGDYVFYDSKGKLRKVNGTCGVR
jgi:hypothetical protein